jgi:2-haloalkanoic acid dehalogenase type II
VSRYEVITFDCYGTLIDWEQGIGDAIMGAAAADGVRLERGVVLAAYAEIEPVVEAEAFRSYREVLTETVLRMAARLGWRLAPGRAGFLAESLPSWPPFPDTNAALERLHAAGLRLGVLSNVDEDLFAGTRENLAVPFDPVITAAQVRSYKPAHGHFRAARQRLGPARWLHAAQSWFHDVEPAVALGIPVAWINRKSEPSTGTVRPMVELRDLAGLADWLGVPSS